MKFEPFMWVTFCDDIRQEVGNKLSYMGVYGANLVVPVMPMTMPKLCCVFNVRLPASAPPRQVVFKLLRDEAVLFESDLTPSRDNEYLMDVPQERKDSHMITVSTIAQLLSFPVTESVALRTRAIVDGKELRGNALELLVAPAAR